MKPTRVLIAEFTCEGEPISKSRARFTKRGSKTYAYTPERTHTGERLIAAGFRSVRKGIPTDAEIAYRVEVDFRCGTRQRRDVDNMVKLVLDGLNGVAWVDDNQVTEVEASKCYVQPFEAATWVRVYEVGRLEPPKSPCIRCGTEFRTYESWRTASSPRKFCSPECGYAYRVERRERACKQCGRTFLAWGPMKETKFCSVACKSESGRADYECTECGIHFRDEKNLGARRTNVWCSYLCRSAWHARNERECKRGHLRADHQRYRPNGYAYCGECNRLRVAASVAARKAKQSGDTCTP